MSKSDKKAIKNLIKLEERQIAELESRLSYLSQNIEGKKAWLAELKELLKKEE